MYNELKDYEEIEEYAVKIEEFEEDDLEVFYHNRRLYHAKEGELMGSSEWGIDDEELLSE